jgi:3',5'-cyclic AMP phosphodiesterase CpdA
MSPKPVLIAQISDLHIKPPGSLAYGRVDTAAALERCIAALNEFRPKPDFVVVSGDLADTPTMEEYEYLKRLLAPLKLPFAGIPGNHDSREMMRAAFPQAAYAFASGPLNQRVEIGGLDLLLLDSSVHGKPHGELDAATLQWLDATLASAAVHDRHLAHGSPEPPQRWRTRADHQAPSAGAADRRRPRPSRDPDDVRWYPDHDLPCAQSRRRSRSGRTASTLIQGRTARVSSPRLVSGGGVWQRGDPPGADWRI